MSRKTPEVRVPRLVGLMAVDARETARARGLLLTAPDRPELPPAVVDYVVVRRHPQPGAAVPWDSMGHVWFDFGPGEGGGGVHEPRIRPPRGGLQRELDEPGDPCMVLSSP
ncbi:PASTA domain-containing protein [Streptomyces sp. NPDC006265]|uniref:PASTA domain-containing protein n=1 Tax=Streptomyces sp. NPDC006265 TaxID=3156740 RepID=UPI0033B9DA61